VLYILILDICLKSLSGEVLADYSAEIHKPLGEHRPENLVICTSTSRRAAAYDGEDSQNSPFTQALLSAACGIFQPNVPLGQALRMKSINQTLVCQGKQTPCIMPAQSIPDSLCLQLSEEIQYDVCLCYRDDGADSALAQSLQAELECCEVQLEGSEKRHLKVFLKARLAPPAANEQEVNALFGCTVILLLVSRGTFADIDTLHAESQANDRHVQLLWKFEIALELFDAGQHTVVPMLTGRKSENFGGRNEFEMIEESDTLEEFWQLQKMPPDLRVKSVVQQALKGLRCKKEFATRMKMDDKMLDHIPLIPSAVAL